MNWLTLVIVDALTDSLRIFIDNYSSDVYFKKRGAVAQKIFYGFAYLIIGIIALCIIGFNPFGVDFSILGLLLLAGALTAIAGIPYFRALELDDSTNLGIFIQLAPILYLILGWLFLGEKIEPIQLLAFCIIISAPILIVLTARKRSRKVKLKAIFYASLYVLLSVVGNLTFTSVANKSIDLIPALSIFIIGKGAANVLIISAVPRWRRRFRTVLKSSKYKVLRPLIANVFVGTTMDLSYSSALVLAPSAAIASATSDSAVPIVIFFMGIVLSIIWPNFGREKLNRKSVIVHLLATILVVIGIILLRN